MAPNPQPASLVDGRDAAFLLPHWDSVATNGGKPTVLRGALPPHRRWHPSDSGNVEPGNLVELCHELANPMTPIRFQVHLLRSNALGALNESQRNSLEMLERNILRLHRVIRDLHNLADARTWRLRMHEPLTRLRGG